MEHSRTIEQFHLKGDKSDGISQYFSSFIHKMVKVAELSIGMRDAVVQMTQRGLSGRKIGALLGIPKSTVAFTVTKFTRSGQVADRSRSGRSVVLTDREKRNVIRTCREDPTRSAIDIAHEINQKRSSPVTKRMIQRLLVGAGLHGRRPARKPLISKSNQKKRLQFALRHRHWSVADWKRVLFTDESRFCLFSDGPRWIRRAVGTRYLPRNTVATVKHGGGSLMVWGGFIANKVVPLYEVKGIMTGAKYVDIIESHVRPWTRGHCRAGFIFQQDNDPKHTSKIARQYFSAHHIRLLEWPPQSADLNPIENLWDALDRAVQKARPKNIKEKMKILMDSWAAIPQETLLKLVSSMPRRLEEVIKVRGMSTRY